MQHMTADILGQSPFLGRHPLLGRLGWYTTCFLLPRRNEKDIELSASVFVWIELSNLQKEPASRGTHASMHFSRKQQKAVSDVASV